MGSWEVEAFQAKEAERHKKNYDKKGRAAALVVGDMVLVHETAFKGQHKMQDRWENREYLWKAALSWLTSVCGMPQGWGRAQLNPS